MADWHLVELDQALTQAGWQIISQTPGDERKVSATWAVQRSTQCLPLLIDFDGMDDMECLPLSRSYACHVRGNNAISLYFSTKGRHWARHLKVFVTALNNAKEEQTNGHCRT